jgi:DNA-binding SARP family transcriptional activator/Flp pilus assembly protein TadD
MDVELRLLGPVGVWGNDRPVPLGGPRQRTVLAALALRAGRAVSVDQLIDAIWGQEPPATARKQVHARVSRLRQALGGRIVTTHEGYVLHVEPDELDVARFDAGVARARRAAAEGRLAEAAERLRVALELWHGPALTGVHGLASEATRLEERRLAALEERIEADLALGRHPELVAELSELVAAHPLRERLWGHLMLALYRWGRQADALATFRELRGRLVAELGIEPGRSLQELQRRILAADPDLEPTPVTAAAGGGPPGPHAVPRELPRTIACFTGRRQELARLERLLTAAGTPKPAPGSVVIATIDGVGGIGKSTLAVHAAHRVVDHFPDGQLYADLQGATAGLEPLTPDAVLARFLRALGLRGEDVPSDVEEAAARFRSLVGDRRMLVVLDNARDAAQIHPLLPGSPGCAVLVTSRQVLGPAIDGASHLHLDALLPADAITLLARIAGGRRVAAEPEAAVRIARLCGFLPLALRIVGARLAGRPGWPLGALGAKLADARRRLDELRAGELDVRSSFEISHQALLDSPEPDDQDAARAFRLLGLVDGPDLGLPVAARLLDLPEQSAERLLERLVDAQLLDSPTPGRYRLHDLLRLLARELCARHEPEAGRLAALERVLRCYLATAQQASRLLLPGDNRRGGGDTDLALSLPLANRDEALAWLDAERANLLAAAVQAAELPGRVAMITVGLAAALFRFYDMRAHWRDWETLNQRALTVSQRLHDRPAEGQALNDLGVAAWLLGRQEAATALFEQALAIRRELGDRQGEGATLNNLGNICLALGQYPAAVTYLEQDLVISREVGDRQGQGVTLSNLGQAYLRMEDLPAARRHLAQALAIHRTCGDKYAEGIVLEHLGRTYLHAGDLAAASDHLGQALEIYQEAGNKGAQGYVLAEIGEAHRRAGRVQQAVDCCERAAALSREVGASPEEGQALWRLGSALADLGHRERAQSCWQQALEVFERLGAPEADKVRALLSAMVREVASHQPGARGARTPSAPVP